MRGQRIFEKVTGYAGKSAWPRSRNGARSAILRTMSPAFPFDAVLFDLDGTLLATDRFWIPAARVGARRAFEELGLEREIPSGEQWMSLVGLPLADGFDMLFADLAPAQRELIMKRCVEEEHFALESGSAALLPGVAQTLAELKELGVPMGIASNCSQGYLDSAMSKVSLRDFIDEGRCLDSRGIRNKADMIEDLLLTFGTRSAVMVGDRAGDRDAAHANGVPHVHLRNGFAPRGEDVQCEAIIDDFLELLPRLRGRIHWMQSVLEQLGLADAANGPKSLGITGRSGAGKSLFGRDIVRHMNTNGRAASLLSLDAYLRPDRPAVTGVECNADASPLEMLERVWRIGELAEGVLEPHSRGRDVSIEIELEGGGTSPFELPGDSTLVLEGLYLLHPRLRALLERVLYLEAPLDLCLRRVAGRSLPLGEAKELERTRTRYLPAQERFDELVAPAVHADLVVDASNPLGGPLP